MARSSSRVYLRSGFEVGIAPDHVRRYPLCRRRRCSRRDTIDPVCGMTVDPHTSLHRHAYQGRPYYFCSAGCRTKFAADPVKYLGGKPTHQEALPEGTIYTCPMHPEVRQVGPGSCPICGMALEPDVATAESGPNPELVDMTRRFWIGAGAHRAGLRAGDGSARPRPSADPANGFELDPTRAGDASGAVGGLAVLRPRRSVAEDAEPQHVHADRDGDRRGLGLQRVATLAPGCVSRRISRPCRCGRGLLRSGCRHHRAGAARPGAGAARARADLAARSARCSISRRKPRTVSCRRRRKGHPGRRIMVGDMLRVRPGEKVPVDGVLDRGPQRRSTSRW